MYQFAQDLRSEKAFLFDRGSTALYALLRAMGVKQGDEVIAPIFTCPAVPWPIVRTGAKPIYVDIDPHTYNLHPDKVKAKITKDTKVIIAQHTFGIPAEMDSILEIARNNNLRVIEDCCHAFGSKYKGQEVGTFGDAAIYSFGWYKPIVLGTGGAAIVNKPDLKLMIADNYNAGITPSVRELLFLYPQYFTINLLFKPSRFWFMKEVYRRLRDFRSGPRKGKIRPLILGHDFNPPTDNQNKYALGQDHVSDESDQIQNFIRTDQVPAVDQDKRQFERKIAPFQEKRLFKKLESFDRMVIYNNWIVSQYEKLLPEAGYSLLELDDHLEPVYYKYPLVSKRKKEIFEDAKLNRVEMSDMFGSPLYPPDRRANWEALGYREGMCPISEKISAEIIALPVHNKVKLTDIEKTMALLEEFLTVS